jgi:hypothetical protein
MFVRFRTVRHRLQASILETRRTAGKVVNEYIASLGSIAVPLTVPGRQAFWANLWKRLSSLGNRIGTDDQAKIRNEVHARIPMVMPEEANADEAEYWEEYSAMWADDAARERERAASIIKEAEKRAEQDEAIAAIFAKNRAAALKGERPMKRVVVGQLLAAKCGFQPSRKDGELCVNPLTGELNVHRVVKRSDRKDRRRRRNGYRFTPKPVEGWEPD